MNAGRVALLGALLAAACGGADEPRAAAVARAPATAGDVWEIDGSGGRETAPAAVLAYLHGLHLMVLDGDRVYAGMTRFEATRDATGARVFRLGEELEAGFVPDGDRIVLRFSSGEEIPMIKREVIR